MALALTISMHTSAAPISLQSRRNGRSDTPAMGARITGLSRVTLPICNFFMLSFLFLFVSVSFPYYS